ncbi:hypothetical protein K443DRAFT_121328 [Laccaria amethystina LaAM-08-1]|uniref:Uncharacterized protein n=1 Tax=Laccaria amethystina LaAM-08-1 TaxID=1095629 RepID=A0A0C9XFG8_9AGAR|nr:hypothetical protein K443DRAFT_121328 [Laccaria amethystina LaAM-08-1]
MWSDKPIKGHKWLHYNITRVFMEDPNLEKEKGADVGELNVRLSVIKPPLQEHLSRLKGDSDSLSDGVIIWKAEIGKCATTLGETIEEQRWQNSNRSCGRIWLTILGKF